MSKYISDISEEEKNSPDYGDVQIKECNDKEVDTSYERSGNQSKEYYQK